MLEDLQAGVFPTVVIIGAVLGLYLIVLMFPTFVIWTLIISAWATAIVLVVCVVGLVGYLRRRWDNIFG